MRKVRPIFLLILVSLVLACGAETKERTPVETLKKYSEAAKNKDLTQMKLLLSEATLKLHTDQAKAQKVTLDEIVQRETFFSPEQRVFAYKNEKIEGERATVDVKNSFGGWDQIILVKEGGLWKIDKKGTALQMIEQVESDVQDLDAQNDADRKKIDELMDQQDAGAPLELQPASPLDSPGSTDPASPSPNEDVPGSPLVTPPPGR